MLKREELETQLKETFKIDKFHEEQWTTINKILNGDRVLLINKTGFGKSLCFQFPATILEGTAIIFTPLIALMRDQVKKLKRLGVSANCIHSEQTPEVNARILTAALKGKTKILYIAPERQESTVWTKAVKQLKISMVVIDEAHCISTWGHDFRPAFQNIVKLVNLLPADIPILATTATATKKVEADIAAQIKGKTSIIRGSLVRANIKLFVVPVSSEEEKLIWLGKNLEKLPGTGILYTGTRSDTEAYARWLQYLKIPAIGYHAGLSNYSRVEIENGLLSNEWKCVVSTNALGMGIDKPDIRFIIHSQIPQSPIHYYQEIGRAGRDNKEATVILFYNPEDRKLPESFINNSRPSVSRYERVIALIKNNPISERTIMRETNLSQIQVRAIKADLLDQGIIREIMDGRFKKYVYIEKSKPLNTKNFEKIRLRRLKELDTMIDYVSTRKPRMQYLCEFLNDESIHSFDNCDNTNLIPLSVETCTLWDQKVQDFRENFFPVLKLRSNFSKLDDGIAASYYEVSTIRTSLQRSKYETLEDFPDYFIRLALKAYRKRFRQEKFDYIAYVPPTLSGDLVMNFAEKLSNILEIPLTHNLIRVKDTLEQRKLKNTFSKLENVSGAFDFNEPGSLKGKSILLIDDIFDSGTTINEIGKLLTKFGAAKISPLVIAKTVNSDIL